MRTIITDGIIEAHCSETTICIKDIINKSTVSLSPEEFTAICKLAVDQINTPDFDSGMKEAFSRYMKARL